MASLPVSSISHDRVRTPARRRLHEGQFIAYAALGTLGFLYLYPVLWIVASSLRTPGEFFSAGLSLWPESWVWENYATAWTRARFSTYFLNTVIICVTTAVFVNLFTSMAGYALARFRFPGRGLLLGLILATFFLPTGYTIIPIFDLVRSLGLNNTLWAVILVATANGMIVNTFLYMGYFTTLPQELDDAARIDGATFPQRFAWVMFPLARPMTATVTLLTFVGTWNEFLLPLVFTLGKPELRTLAIGVYAFVGENSRDWTAMCAATIITILPIVLVFLVLQRSFIEGVSGAVK
jgi:raffinose/stachyose/melibiose transport system permease protein